MNPHSEEYKSKPTGNPFFNMRPTVLTQENQDFIKENYTKYSQRILADMFNCSRGVIFNYMRKAGLKNSDEIIASFRMQRNAINANNAHDISEPIEDTGNHKRMYKYARELGYRNVSHALKCEGRSKFINKYKSIIK